MSEVRRLAAGVVSPLYEIGVRDERERIIALLIEHKMMRVDALGSTVFVNCDTLEVEYLQTSIINGEHHGRNV